MDNKNSFLSILDEGTKLKKEVKFAQEEILTLIDKFSPDIKDDFLSLREMFLLKRQGNTVELENIKIEPQKMSSLIKAFSLYLIMLNVIEERDLASRSNFSIKDVIDELIVEGFDIEDIKTTLKEIEFNPVFTAHPTESRRRTFLEAHHELSSDLKEIFDNDNEYAKNHLRYRLSLLWQSDLIRKEKIEVLFELDNLLYIVESSMLSTLVKFSQEIESVVGELDDSIVKLGSWIGGDRDGNPYVTNDVMTKAMKTQHNAIINLYISKLDRLLRELSISSNHTKPSRYLLKSIDSEIEFVQNPNIYLFQNEPFRLKLAIMKEKLENRILNLNSPNKVEFAYKKPNELIADIDLLIDSLDKESSYGLKKIRNLVLIGGFHLLKMDFREHKDTLKCAITEVFSYLGYSDSDFLTLPKNKQTEIINKALSKPKIELQKLLGKLTSDTERFVEAFIKIEWAKDNISKTIIDSFIISMTEDANDLLMVLWFAKQANLWQRGKKAKISITPLFETIDDLKKCPQIMKELFGNSHYHAYLKDREFNQEVMIGYSDSSKDGGIFASNFNLNRAINSLMDLEKELNVKFLLFHGRGGSVSRGGLPTHHAIMASPAKSVDGFLKVTEQGEVISSKYLNKSLSYYNIAQTVSALLKKSIYDKFDIRIDCGKDDSFVSLMQCVSDNSYKAYRTLVYETDGFIDYFKDVTPIQFIGHLNIGSRPSKRKKSDKIEDLRAIPWVFAWTQNRSIIPAWYGVGSGIEACEREYGIEMIIDCYNKCPFFQTTVDNVSMSLLKVDLKIAQMYNQFSKDKEKKDIIWEMILAEYEKTKRYLLLIRQETILLEKEKSLRQSILLREPYLTALNIFQIELIKKYNNAKFENINKEQIIDKITSTIVGIAQGMRNTG
ncbi:MAG: phosphoenolpyruvate carboxylase [Campylobacterales bacterium]|nr:phosphoenolpyruvate carboxylase [Campylobacterales bacterium]